MEARPGWPGFLLGDTDILICLTSPSPGFEHGVDELEDGALVGGRKFLDAAEAFQEPRGPGRQLSR